MIARSVRFWCFLSFTAGVAVVINSLPAGSGDIYEPIPPGPEYPLDSCTIQKWIETNSVHLMRRHAWNIFSELTKPANIRKDMARWETWYTVEDVFAPAQATSAHTQLRRSFEESAELRAAQSALKSPYEEHKFRPAAFILYNQDAYRWIRTNKLYLEKTLEDLLRQGKSIPAFPKTSIVLKTEWIRVPGNGSTERGLWNSELPVPGSVHNLATYFPGKVCVAAEVKSCASSKWPPHPLREFYSFQIKTQKERDLMRALEEFQNAEIGDYAALLGLHFATKEQQNWVWATFWWHDKPSEGPYADERPPTLRRPWDHYVMNVSYDMDKPREPDGGPHIAFNPYLESGVDDGVKSNCMTCHFRATWSKDLHQKVCILLSDGSLSLPELPGISVRGSQAARATYLNTPYEERLPLSFMWSLALHATGEPPAAPSDPGPDPECGDNAKRAAPTVHGDTGRGGSGDSRPGTVPQRGRP